MEDLVGTRRGYKLLRVLIDFPELTLRALHRAHLHVPDVGKITSIGSRLNGVGGELSPAGSDGCAFPLQHSAACPRREYKC